MDSDGDDIYPAIQGLDAYQLDSGNIMEVRAKDEQASEIEPLEKTGAPGRI